MSDTVCKTHPDAPHGFDRNASHSEDRYVCDCEWWNPPEADSTATYTPPCQHLTGWYVTVKFWIFSKRVFVCSDCGSATPPTKETP